MTENRNHVPDDRTTVPRRRVLPSLLSPPLTLTELVGPEDFNPPVKHPDEVVVKCSDGQAVVLPNSAVSLLPLKEEEPLGSTLIYSFDYPHTVLAAMYYWASKYGSDREPETKVPDVITFTDFNAMSESAFDKELVARCFHKDDEVPSETLLFCINAAEHHKWEPFLTFLIALLSCIIRGKSELEILGAMQIPEGKELTEEDKTAVHREYPWLRDATKAKTC